MRLQVVFSIACSVGLLAVVASGQRTSSNYRITAEVIGAGGQDTTNSSGGVSMRGSVSDRSTGTSSNAAMGQVAAGGFLGQLYELVALDVSVAPTTVVEGLTRPLSVVGSFSDATTAQLADVSFWTVLNGPLSGVDGDGAAVAENVLRDEHAALRGEYDGFTGQVALLVLNTSDDDFGLYAGDGAPDLWQVLHFGTNNPAGVGTFDGDGDGTFNTFEYGAGTDPTNEQSVFAFSILPMTSGVGLVEIELGPAFTSRIYGLERSTNLRQGLWSPVAVSQVVTAGMQLIVREADPPAPVTAYRTRIELRK